MPFGNFNLLIFLNILLIFIPLQHANIKFLSYGACLAVIENCGTDSASARDSGRQTSLHIEICMRIDEFKSNRYVGPKSTFPANFAGKVLISKTENRKLLTTAAIYQLISNVYLKYDSSIMSVACLREKKLNDYVDTGQTEMHFTEAEMAFTNSPTFANNLHGNLRLTNSGLQIDVTQPELGDFWHETVQKALERTFPRGGLR